MASTTPEEARVIAGEGLVYGYPLVLMDLSMRLLTSLPSGAGGAGVNRLDHRRRFPDASFTDVVSPNADTLYSTAMLDLRGGPLLLAVPASDRYYLLPMLTAWTDVFAAPGTRTTGTGAHTWAVTGPGWSGELPDGAEEIRCPTGIGWLVGRTQTNGAADYEAVHRFQDSITLEPMAGTAQVGDPAPPSSTLPPPEVLDAMDATTFFSTLAALMVDAPPAPADAPLLERLARIGLAPGSYEPPAGLEHAIERGRTEARAALASVGQDRDAGEGSWTIHRGLGSYGTNYARRAYVALVGLGANLDADAVYPHTAVDAAGEPLDGAHRYRLHFPADALPPANAFWSLTMYDARQYFVDNPVDRFAIGDRDALLFADDGSLDLWLQHDDPGDERRANWLPAPEGAFNLVLRIYWPGEEVLDGRWMPPPVERLAG
jgi:hypothetical protein